MNYLDLFSGIGGFALGAYWAGMKFDNHYASEIDPYCVKLYQKRFPDSIQLGDIKSIETDKLPKGEWIITGGFPCQDISIAGKGAGIHGARSGLWFEYFRLIRDLRPRFAIMENVGMLVHRGLREVLGSLAEIGYDAEWQDIRASDMGAPHRRERIWIVAYPEIMGRGNGFSKDIREETRNVNPPCDENKIQPEYVSHPLQHGCGDSFSTQKGTTSNNQKSNGKDEKPGRKSKQFGIIEACSDVADTRRTGLQKSICPQFRSVQSQIGKSARSEFSGGDAETREYWSTEPDVGRLAHGIPNRVDRLKGLGNSIVPQIAELLFNQIKEFIQ